MSQYCSFDVQPSAQNNAPNAGFQGHLDQLCGNKEYEAKVIKIAEFGAFCELEPGLTTLLHSSDISWTRKNITPNKNYKNPKNIISSQPSNSST